METLKKERRPSQKKQARMRRRQQMGVLLGGVLLAAILLVCLINFCVKDREFSNSENRMLATRPNFSLQSVADGSYTKALESYQADQFFARDWWVSLKLWQEKVLGRRQSNGVYLGKDHYLMQMPQTPDSEQVQKNLDALTSFAQRYPDLHLQMLLVPNAVWVLSDKLPANAPVRDQQADLQDIQEKLPESFTWLDVSQSLKEHAQEGLFYRTDHHWTSLGAYYAFTAAAEGLGLPTPLKQYVSHTVSDSFEGTLASKSGSHAVLDTICVYEPQEAGNSYYVTYDDTKEKSSSLFVSKCLEEKDQYTVFFGGNHPSVTIRTTNNNDRCLLIFKDSYANSFVQFLTPYYETILLVDPRYYYEDAGALVSRERVTDVLFLYNLDTYLGDNSLADVLDAAQKPAQTEETVPQEPAQT